MVCFLGLHEANAQSPIPSDKSNFHLFVLAGQSNMAGRGRLDDAASKPDQRVLMLNQEGQWVPAVDPVHFDKPKMVGVGLGRTFARDYVEAFPDATVGLIPCAVGGSPIDSWQPGGYHKSTGAHPYDDALKRVNRARRDGTLKGVLWHQGESDSKPLLATEYESKLHTLISRMRREFQSPDLPFVIGQMGQFVERREEAAGKESDDDRIDARAIVDAVHRETPGSVPHTAFASSSGLGHKGDRVHFSTAAYRALGHRFFQAYLSLGGASGPLGYSIDQQVVQRGFDGKRCWVHARAGVVRQRDASQIVMTTQPLLLSGSDVFYSLNQTLSDDGGESWQSLKVLESFVRQSDDKGHEFTVCDFTPKWHAKSKTLLGTGQTVWYEHNKVMHVRPRSTAYSVFDPKTETWAPWKRLEMPQEARFKNAGAGSVQRFDEQDGTILLPIYFKVPERKQYSTTVVRCQFDGAELKYVEHGNELTIPVKRGLYEPSVTRFDRRYFLTMRNDDRGYVSVSRDGLEYSDPVVWRFDDGEELGNYNTQQHWVTHSDGLFLVYTRRGLDNDHVFRHRAPLMIARVDPETLRVMRTTERVIAQEKGARLGNFGVVDVNQDETWVVVTEWMQPLGVEKYGSDNRIYAVKLKWNRPNRAVE